MATLTKINGKADGVNSLTFTTLTASDAFTFSAGNNTLILFYNSTGGSLTATVKGDTATSKTIDGIGPVSLSAGVPVTVAATSFQRFFANSRKEFLAGTTVTVTGAAGLGIAIIEV